MSYVVTAPLVISKKEDGSDLYLYEGAVVPDHVSAEDIKRFSDLGFITEDTPGGAKSKKPTSSSN